MNVFTSTELASQTKTVCATVRETGCAFVTNNGKIDCMMIDLSTFTTINEAIHAYDSWVAQHDLERMWQRNANSTITLEDIDNEIAAVRAERHQKSNR